MDLRSMSGFLGTKAYLLADLTLVAYVLLIVPGMITGFIFARRKMFVPHHKYMMTTVVIVNWLLILFLMAVSYGSYVAPGVPQKLGEPFYGVPSAHLVFGGLAQILGTILVVRMWFEYQLPRFLRFEPIKPWMRLTLGLWLITATLGALTYLTWYGVPFSGGSPAPEPTPMATQEATESAPAATEEVAPAATEEATPEAAPETAPEATPEATEEATQAPN